MTDPTADWPPMPDGAPFLVPVPPKAIGIDELTRMGSRLHGVEARLRTTAEALRGEVDDIDWIFACFPALSEVLTADQIARLCQRLTDARAVLAQLEQDGLT